MTMCVTRGRPSPGFKRIRSRDSGVVTGAGFFARVTVVHRAHHAGRSACSLDDGFQKIGVVVLRWSP